MPANPIAVLVAIAGLVGLTVPFVVLTWVSLRRDEHTPQALQEGD